MTEFVASDRGTRIFKIHGKTIQFRGKTPWSPENNPDWIVFTKIIFDEDKCEYVVGEEADDYLTILKIYANQNDWVLAFDYEKSPDEIFEKWYRFNWRGGGLQRKVTRWDLFFMLLIIFFVLFVAWVLQIIPLGD